MAVEMTIPFVTWKKRAIPEGDTDYKWVTETSEDIFAGKRVVVFSLPGAFTPTCSSTHLPGFEAMYDDVIAQDIDEIYCLSVNDSFVMNAWLNSLSVSKVKPIADGNGDFTRHMGMLVEKRQVTFGYRSQRYAMVVDNGRIEMIFVEEGKEDNYEGDPFVVSSVESVLRYLENVRDLRRAELGLDEETNEDTDSTVSE
jgi:peroxiredoxin